MAKRAKAYRGEKRSKELVRQKRQEEKRLRRHGKKTGDQPEAEQVESAEISENAPSAERASTES